MKIQARGGITFLEALLLIFIVLKLCGLITWSWWWVLSPFWIPVVIVLFILLICVLLMSLKYFRL